MIHKYYRYIGIVPGGIVPVMIEGIVPEMVERIVIVGGIVPIRGLVPELV